MICKYCGATLEDGSKFCDYCGSNLEETVVAQTPVQEPVQETPVVQAPVQETPVAQAAPVYEDEPVKIPQPLNEEPVAQPVQPTQPPKAATAQPKKKSNTTAIVIICAIIAFWLILFIVGGIIAAKFISGVFNGVTDIIDEVGTQIENIDKGDYDYDFDWNLDDEDEDEDDETPTTTVDTKVVGTSDFGYITIPKNWVKFTDIDGNSTDQYSTLDGQYIITLYAVDGIDAETYANSVYANLEAQDEVSGLTGAQVKIAGYDSYQVYCYYPDEDIVLVTWQFDAKDGKAHYVAYEGPDAEYIDLVETFSLTK